MTRWKTRSTTRRLSRKERRVVDLGHGQFSSETTAPQAPFVSSSEPAEHMVDSEDPIEEFYTRHPYPPPVENLDRAREEWADGSRDRSEFHLFWPDKAYRPDLDILVAGCGTWQAAK